MRAITRTDHGPLPGGNAGVTGAILAVFALLFSLAACSDANTVKLEDFGTRDVTLPGGQVIHAEIASTQPQVEHGLMFRTSLAPDRGMLFMHREAGEYPYWMYQVRIPLDMIWMDPERRVVEIAAAAQPCKTEPGQCPTYGGHRRAQYVLELAGGMAAKYGIKTGDTLEF